MNTFTVGDLQELLGERKGPCVSVFAPTHRSAKGAQEDRVRFKNLVDTARRKLEAVVAPRAVPRLVAPLEEIAAKEFGGPTLDGLAVFSAPGFTRHWRLSTEVPERVIVSDTFHVAPLIQHLQSQRRWYVLTLAGDEVKFFEATPAGLVPKAVPDMPRTPDEAQIVEHERPGTSAHSSGTGKTAIHGSGEPRSDREDKARWFRAVDVAVCRLLRDEQAPLVVAGVTRLTSVYRAVSRYPHLVSGAVDGNFRRARTGELHARAAPAVLAALRTREDEAVAEYQRLNGARRSSDDIGTVASAAVLGRVRRLMIARGRSVRGAFDRVTGEVKRRAPREDAFGDDVLDDIAGAVLVRGGEVLVVDSARMPTSSPLAAALRW